jgi:hypothetical protein
MAIITMTTPLSKIINDISTKSDKGPNNSMPSGRLTVLIKPTVIE